ncbi:MAG: hypothetical protein C4348_02170 [Patescibacteria group bacterium]
MEKPEPELTPEKKLEEIEKVFTQIDELINLIKEGKGDIGKLALDLKNSLKKFNRAANTLVNLLNYPPYTRDKKDFYKKMKELGDKALKIIDKIEKIQLFEKNPILGLLKESLFRAVIRLIEF